SQRLSLSLFREFNFYLPETSRKRMLGTLSTIPSIEQITTADEWGSEPGRNFWTFALCPSFLEAYAEEPICPTAPATQNLIPTRSTVKVLARPRAEIQIRAHMRRPLTNHQAR